MTLKKLTSLQKVSFATLISAGVEWYCFLLYGMAAGTVFNKIFFPSNIDPYMGQILAYLSFAIGYLARPFGAMFFGNYGDKLGRKFTVIASLALMGVSTFAIGCIPNYSQIGIWAPVLLQFFRLTQCFGLGGKWGGGILMTFENADPKERAFYASIPQLGLPLGLVTASLILAGSSNFFSQEFFLTYGWRIAFLVSAILMVIIMYIRFNIMETDDFIAAQEKAKVLEKTEKAKAMPLAQVFKSHSLTILLGIGTRWIDGVFYNVFAVFTLSYATAQLGVSDFTMFIVNIVFAIASMPFVLLSGKIADKIGKGKMYVYSTLACALFAIPGMQIIAASKGNPFIIGGVIIVGWSIFYSGIWGVLGSLWAQLFEPEVRYTGISFVYHAPSFFVAGIVPMISTYLLKVNNGNPILIGYFVTIVGLISAFCGYTLQKRYDRRVEEERKNIGFEEIVIE